MTAITMATAACGGPSAEERDLDRLAFSQSALALLIDIRDGESEAKMERDTQGMVDTIHETEDSVSEEAIRNKIDETIELLDGTCEDCETLLRDARP